MKYYSIGEVCNILDVKPHVLRYWEQEIPALTPRKNHFGNRVYTRRDIQAYMRIRHLLYERKYTIEGARKAILEEMSDRAADSVARIEEMRDSLLDLLTIVEDRKQQNRGE